MMEHNETINPNPTETQTSKKEAPDGKNVFLDGEMLAKMVRGGAAQLRSNAQEVNNLNVFPVPDGDTGDNMRMTIEGGVAALEGMSTSNLAEIMKSLSQGMLLGARGNSGVILSQFFAGMTNGLAQNEKVDAKELANALKEGVKQAYASVITPTEGTILTVAREAVDYAAANLNEESTIRSLFADLIKEMYASLQRTPEILAVLKEAGVVDSGGAGLFYIMEGFYKVLQGEDIDTESIPAPEQKAQQVDFASFGPDSEMTYGYCTELLLQLQNAKTDPEAFDVGTVTAFLQEIGDSIVAFKTGTIIKLHVHTKTPEKVLAFCRQYGEFLTVKIENMSVQHNESITQEQSAAPQLRQAPVAAQKKYGVAAVASGAGIAELFCELGVDAIVPGGQTQNPSASDFLEAFASIPAEHIFVFPNNGNIVMAAKQAAQMYEQADVHVIESKDLGQGYAAISSMNFQCDDPDKIAAQLTEAMSSVRTGSVSTAVRSTDLNGVHIENGDYIGFVGKEMLVSCKDKMDAARGLLEKMGVGGDDVFMLTVFLGKDATQADQETLEQYLETSCPDVEAYFVRGEQEVYPFLFVVE